MNLFPMMVDLTGKTVLILGTGEEAEDKARRMAPFGCVLDCRRTEEFGDFSDPLPALVILADRFHPKNAAIAAQCRSLGIPVNAVDDPSLCDFIFPSLITRGSLTVALSTGGAAPAAGKLLRQRIEQALPEDTEGLMDWAGALTARLRASIPDMALRGRILRFALDRAFTLGRPLTEDELSVELQK